MPLCGKIRGSRGLCGASTRPPVTNGQGSTPSGGYIGRSGVLSDAMVCKWDLETGTGT